MKQTNKQTNKETNTQTKKQTHKQTNRQPTKQTYNQPNMQTTKQTNNPPTKQTKKTGASPYIFSTSQTRPARKPFTGQNRPTAPPARLGRRRGAPWPQRRRCQAWHGRRKPWDSPGPGFGTLTRCTQVFFCTMGLRPFGVPIFDPHPYNCGKVRSYPNCFSFCSLFLAGEPIPPKKTGQRALLGDLAERVPGHWWLPRLWLFSRKLLTSQSG